MPIVQAKCTNCGANLEVDSTREAAVCPFCGTAYVVEKAVNNYNTVNNNQIQAQVVNIYGGTGDFTVTGGTLQKYAGSSTHPTVPAGVRFIGEGAFKGLRALEAVTLPAGLREIGKEAFSGCDGLTDLSLPDTLESIGEAAFDGCTRLLGLALPAGLRVIGEKAFRGCESLEKIELPEGITYVSNFAFKNCSGLKSLRLPGTMREVCCASFSHCSALESLTLPESLGRIDISGFEACRSLKTLRVPGSVKVLDQQAFCGCTGLTSLVLENGLREIGSEAFRGCTGLRELVLPDSLGWTGPAQSDSNWPQRTFADCTALKSVRIGAGMGRLHRDMFEGCTALETLTVPETLRDIDSNYCVRSRVRNVVAPEAWKRAHATELDCLAPYRKTAPQKKKGCYVATAVYGSYDCPEVWVLRRWRDRALAATPYGRAFIRFYYAVSPAAVKYFGRTKAFGRLFRPALDRLTARLRREGFADTPYRD